MTEQEYLRDPLTGVYSRASFNERLKEEIQRARRGKDTLSLLLMDIDHFKSINDGFGHARGDQILIEFSQRLQTIFRDTDIIFRYGGDEFVILLPETGKYQAEVIIQRLLDHSRAHPYEGDPPLMCTLSIGLACFPEDGLTPVSLFSIADQRSYQAKREGRDRYVAEDAVQSGLLPLEEPSRLLERDESLEVMHRFLDALPEFGLGVLQVIGPEGVGKTRLLREAREAAQLLGFSRLKLQGHPAYKTRVHGVLAEALLNWEEKPPEEEVTLHFQPSIGAERLAKNLQDLLRENVRTGLLVTVEDLPHIDASTLGFLRDLLVSWGDETDFQLAFVFATEYPGAFQRSFRTAPLRESVTLQPVSRAGLRIWVRHVLQWEAPEEFLDWFYSQTQGYPGRIQKGLTTLVSDGLILPVSDGWKVSRELQDLPLEHLLAQQNAAIHHNLPSGLTDFIGREAELRTVKELFQDHRLVTVLAAGGMGKTRLAIQAAAESVGEFPHGVFFVPLMDLDTVEQLVFKIAEALGYEFFGVDPPRSQLLNFIQQRSLLLVLDSFEDLIESADLIDQILDQAAAVSLLVTSRERVGLPREVIYELQGMTYPAEGEETRQAMALETGSAFDGYSAIQLFQRSARRADPDFSLADEDRPHVIRVCQLLEGTPLGIELAASWVNTFPPGEIYDLIRENLAFLTQEQPHLIERHQSMTAVIDSFWQQLFEPEQRNLRRLSVMRGGFKRDAGGRIAGASPFFLDAMVAKTFLRRTPDGRYHTHGILSHYAIEKARACQAEWEQAQADHSTYFMQLLIEKDALMKSSGQREAAREIGQEIENIRAAWEWAVKHEQAEQIGQALGSLFYFYYMRSWFKEGAQVFEQLMEYWRETPASEQRSSLMGKAMARQGWFAFHQGDHALARQQLSESLALLPEGNEAWEEKVFRLNYLGGVHRHRGENRQAQSVLEESLAICGEHGDTYNSSIAMNMLGQIAFTQGEYPSARKWYREALDLKRQLGDRWGAAFTLEYLGQLAFTEDQHQEAKELFNESLAIRREMGDSRGTGLALDALGDVAQALSEFAEAKQLYAEALAVFKDIGNKLGIVQAINSQGQAAFQMGDIHLARELFLKALGTARELDAAAVAIESLLGIASVMVKSGEAGDARGLLLAIRDHRSSSQEDIQQAEELLVEIGTGQVWKPDLEVDGKPGKAIDRALLRNPDLQAEMSLEAFMDRILGEGD